MAIVVKGVRTSLGEGYFDYNYLANKPDDKMEKLDGIEDGAQKNTITSVNGKDGEVQLTANDVNAFGKTDNIVLVKGTHYGDKVPTTGLVTGRVFFVKVSE